MVSPRLPAQILEEEIIPYLTHAVQEPLRCLPLNLKNKLLEIRLRVGRPVMLVYDGGDMFLSEGNALSKSEMEQTVQFVTRSSIYACEEELRQGFLTLPGGHRVGIVGKAVLDEGRIRTIKHISSLNIRLARQVIGAANAVLPYLVERNSFVSTLIVSPPGCGKTTLLRDLIRQLSTGIPRLKIRGYKIGVVDERSEIAACFRGMQQNDVGPRTDVLDGARKAEGIMLLLRSMSPEIIATDEVGSSADIIALEEALVSGVRLIATAHGDGIDDLKQRPVLRELVEKGLFGRIVILGLSQGAGTTEAIYNGRGLKSVFVRTPITGGKDHETKIYRRPNTDLRYG